MGHHKSRRPTSSDSGYDTTSERSYSPPSSPSSVPASAKVGFAKQRSLDYDVTSLFTSATRTDLTAAIGTQLSDIQISSLNVHQLRELAILASERGVVFFRDQDLTAQDQLRIFDHFGSFHGKQITERDAHSLKIKSSPTDHGERFTLSGRQNHWVSEQSFEVRPPSYTLLKAEEAGGDTVWVSQYGLYDGLSKHMRGFLDSLQAIHTTRKQFETIINLRGMPSDRAPVEITHPAVRTHPVTGLRALNVTPSSVTGFAELSTFESDKVLELLEHHLLSADELTVRFRWEAGSVAIWDNRSTAFKHIGTPGARCETSAIGEKPYFDSQSESRSERAQRLVREAKQERVRLEEIKARYNNTPLRRILRKQAFDRILSPTKTDPSHQNIRPVTPEKTRSNTPLSSDGVKVAKRAKQGAKRVDPENVAIASEEEKNENTGTESGVRVVVSSKGSPLRRILQRQASGNIGAPRRDWK